MATSICAVLGFIFSLTAMVFNVVSIATPHWLNAEGDLKMDIGLFLHCDTNNKYCGGMEEISAIIDVQEAGWFRAIQATFLLGTLGTLLSCILGLLVLIRFFDNKGSYKFVAIVNILSLASEVLSIVLFGFYYKSIFIIDDHYGVDAYIGYSFYAAIVACTLLFISFILHAMEASHAAELLKNMQHRFTIWTTPYTLFIDQEP